MAEPENVRVMIVDDHPIVRNGIAFSLLAFDDILLVGEAANGEDAVRICGELSPDVVLMDMIMPGMDGVAATRAIRHYYPRTQVLVLTSFPEAELVRAALQAGAIGYLLKNVAIDELAQAIRATCASRSTLSKEATEALLYTSGGQPASSENLTERQREVLALVVVGKSNQEIAHQLVISLPTVRFHVSTILDKLGAANRAEAAALAVKNRLIS